MDQTRGPQPAGEPLAPLVRQVLARTADEDSYRRWERQVATTGYCSHPVWLIGGVEAADRHTGELRPVFSTEGEPDGVLLKACGNRRASRCRSCSAVYRADTWQLVAAGLRGGKGIAEPTGAVVVHQGGRLPGAGQRALPCGAAPRRRGHRRAGIRAAGALHRRPARQGGAPDRAAGQHVRRLVEACWQLGAQPHLAELQLRRWAHMLGFRGHFSTRSRRYSTTLTPLRSARADHQRATAAARHPDRAEESPVDPAVAGADLDSIEVISRWRYAGSGYRTEGDRLLAASAADRYWLSREEARLHRRTDDVGMLLG